jgi:hypothetical protein
MLHFLTSPNSFSNPGTSLLSHEKVLESVRELLRDLGKVRRDDIIPVDTEREKHEREEHDGEGILDGGSNTREMEGLEVALEGLVGGVKEERMREEVLLNDFERRVKDVEKAVWDLMG